MRLAEASVCCRRSKKGEPCRDRADRNGAWVDFMKERAGRHGPKRHFAEFGRVSAHRGAERKNPSHGDAAAGARNPTPPSSDPVIIVCKTLKYRTRGPRWNA